MGLTAHRAHRLANSVTEGLVLKLQYFDHLMQRTDWLKRPWFWERLKAGGEEEGRGWDGWMVSSTQGTWVWANSGRRWRTEKPGMLQSLGSQSQTRLSDWTTTIGKLAEMSQRWHHTWGLGSQAAACRLLIPGQGVEEGVHQITLEQNQKTGSFLSKTMARWKKELSSIERDLQNVITKRNMQFLFGSWLKNTNCLKNFGDDREILNVG